MLYQIRERKRIPEASLFYTQKFIFNKTREIFKCFYIIMVY